jgi:hypothetical protein
MVRIKPAEPRSTISEESDGLIITIPIQRQWYVLVFLASWLAMWIFIVVTLAGMVIFGNVPPNQPGVEWFMLALLVGWSVLGIHAVRSFLWHLVGEEEVAINDCTLTIRRLIWGLGRSNEFDFREVRHLRSGLVPYNPPGTSSKWMGNHYFAYAVNFDYGARTYHFGIGLDEAETKLLVAEILQRFPNLGPSGVAPQRRFS